MPSDVAREVWDILVDSAPTDTIRVCLDCHERASDHIYDRSEVCSAGGEHRYRDLPVCPGCWGRAVGEPDRDGGRDCCPDCEGTGVEGLF